MEEPALSITTTETLFANAPADMRETGVKTTSTNVTTSVNTVHETKDLVETLKDLTHVIAFLDSLVVAVRRTLMNALPVLALTAVNASMTSTRSSVIVMLTLDTKELYVMTTSMNASLQPRLTTAWKDRASAGTHQGASSVIASPVLIEGDVNITSMSVHLIPA